MRQAVITDITTMPRRSGAADGLAAASAAVERPLAARYRQVRDTTEALARDLTPEDQTVQAMEDASPAKWHRAHTTWFFETFILVPHAAGYRPCHPDYTYLFNSYYEAVGPRHARPQRGLITRPGVAEVTAYRAHVDAAMARFLEDEERAAPLAPLVELGLHHEQQHQELLLMDILALFAANPTRPAFRAALPPTPAGGEPARWLAYEGGIRRIGHGAGEGSGFAYDNEGPRHDVLLQPFRLSSRPVSNAAWKAFIADGGYRTPTLWLSDGWAAVQREGWTAPGYWRCHDGGWHAMTLGGERPVEDEAPVCHVSYYEADAFARWAGARLPGEAEWEVAADGLPPVGNTLGSGHLRPVPAAAATATTAAGAPAPAQMFGDVWEWTASAYARYPGFRAAEGAVGEYNGKFMANQFVLRGGCCATPDGHVRATYRNFFYPHQRWMFSGVRLAEDA